MNAPYRQNDEARTRDALWSIPANCDHDYWVKIGMAIKSEYGDGGFDMFDAWSQQADSYNAASAKSTWKGITPIGGITLGTLFYEAKRHGWSDAGQETEVVILMPEELQARDRERAAREAQDQADKKRLHKDAARKAHALWDAGVPAADDHPYLVRKQIKSVGYLKEMPADQVTAILGYQPKSGEQHLSGRVLIAPVLIDNDLTTAELIDEHGLKSAIYGGAKAGGFWQAQDMPEGDGTGTTILIAEGVATAISAREATDHLSVAALSNGQLKTVAQTMRTRYPAATVVILADLLKATGEADPKAIEAALSTGALLAVPDFAADRPDGATDFNDMAAHCGLDAVKRAVAAAVHPGGGVDAREPGGEPVPAPAPSGWPDPQPLTSKIEREPFPLDALPATIRAAVEEVAAVVKAPVPLVTTTALSAVSVAVQAYVDVKRAERLQGPCSLYLMAIADSGERKTTCDNYFTAAIRKYEAEQAELAKPQLKQHAADLAAWTAKRDGILAAIKKAGEKNEQTQEAQNRLAELEHAEPARPRFPRLLYGDVTPEALAFSLAKSWPCGGVVSSEGGSVLGAHGMGKDSVMRNLAMLNQLWEGRMDPIDRRTTESFSVKGARLTVALQVQDATLREFFSRSGALARGTGFLARFLIAFPESTQGQRMFTEPPNSWPALSRFNERIAAILAQEVAVDSDGVLTPTVLGLSPEAKSAWIEFHDTVENGLRGGGELYDIRDVASKAADNAARMACLFHTFEGGLGPISATAFEGASQIVAWYLSESRRFFGELALPDELAGVARLDGWLIDFCNREQAIEVPTKTVQQSGPNSLRKGNLLGQALSQLNDLGRARLRQDGRRKLIAVNPALLIRPS